MKLMLKKVLWSSHWPSLDSGRLFSRNGFGMFLVSQAIVRRYRFRAVKFPPKSQAMSSWETLCRAKKAPDLCNQDLTRVLDHEIDALVSCCFFRGPDFFTVFRACSESFSPPPNKMILGIFEYAVLLLYAIIFIRSYDSCHIWSGHMYSTVGPAVTPRIPWYVSCFERQFPALANAGFSLALPKGASCSWSRCGVLVAQPSFCEDVDSGFFSYLKAAAAMGTHRNSPGSADDFIFMPPPLQREQTERTT